VIHVGGQLELCACYHPGIQWISGNSLENLEYTDDLALLPHFQPHTSPKLNAWWQLGLRINKDNTKIIKSKAVILANGSVEEVGRVYIPEKCSKSTIGTDQPLEPRMGKAWLTLRTTCVDKLWISK